MGIKVYESVWTRPSGNLCEHQNTFYGTRFPEKDTVRADSKLRVRISKAHRPDAFKVAAYRGLDKNGEPAGEGALLKRTLERVVKGDKTVAWVAIFSVDEPARDYYLVGEGHWREREGCGATSSPSGASASRLVPSARPLELPDLSGQPERPGL